MIPAKGIRQVFLIIAVLLIYPDYCQSHPREVILYPEFAMITEAKKIRIATTRDQRTAVFMLPAGALPQSTKISLPPDSRLQINDVTYQPHPGADDERIRELKKQLVVAEEENIRLRSNLASVEGQILFWQTQAKGKAKNNAEALVLSQSIARNLKKLHQEKMQSDRVVEQNLARIKDIKGEIARREAKSDTNWQVTVLLTGPSLTETSLSWTYISRGCGWRPFYRLNALPNDKLITVSLAAEVWQDTGQDWNQINLTLASGEPAAEPSATGPTPWTIKTLPETRTVKAGIIEEKRSKPAAAPSEATLTLQKLPDNQIISLGSRTVPSNLKLKFPLTEENWPAEFIHRIRPGLAAYTTLTGFTSFPGWRSYPAGSADYFMAGSFWRRGAFSFTSQSAEIEFGHDPQVLISVRRIFEKPEILGTGGESVKVHRWHWITSVHNQRDFAIKLRLEENLPQFPDKRIRGAINHDPPPDEQTPTEAAWLRDLPAREKITFTGGLVLKMPPQLDVSPEIKP